MVFINQPTASQPDLPFEELSVLTVELAEQGIHEFVNKKIN
jgi:hypothetical protein